MSVAQKACTKCGQIKPLSEYQKRRDSKDGHAHWCRACQSAYDQERKARKAERWRERYATDPEFREKCKARIRQIYATNEEYRNTVRASVKIWQRANQKRVAAGQRRRYKAYYGVVDRQRKYWRRAVLQERGSFTTAEWKALCRRFKNRCAWCKQKKKLTVDHIVPLSKGGGNTIDNIQPLCYSCNSRKYNKTIDFRKGEATQLELPW